jgi:hypothetical protein
MEHIHNIENNLYALMLTPLADLYRKYAKFVLKSNQVINRTVKRQALSYQFSSGMELMDLYKVYRGKLSSICLHGNEIKRQYCLKAN